MSTKKIYNKREYILEKSKDIFTKKGFTSVTMTDIIDACNISRGGLYLYFSSVDEIFIEMILSINAQKLNEAKTSVTEDKTFTFVPRTTQSRTRIGNPRHSHNRR